MISVLASMFSTVFFTAIVYTILHSLWQGALLALMMNVYLRYSKNTSSVKRYNIALTSLLMMAGAAVLTFCYYYGLLVSDEVRLMPEYIAGVGSDVQRMSSDLLGTNGIYYGLVQAIPYIAGFWVVGVVFFGLRVVIGYSFLNKVKSNLDWNIPDWMTAKMKELKSELEIEKSIAVALSDKVISPMMMGFFKPIIVFPFSAMTTLDEQEIELILRHELGHILRNDYLHNIVIRVIETLMFYHPCVWWTSSIVQKERENHCDDYAITGSGDRMAYAKTLVKIRELETSHNYTAALGFSKDNQSLLNRVKRILNQNQKMSIMKGNLIVAAVLFSSIVCISASTYFSKNEVSIPDRIESKVINTLDIVRSHIPILIHSSIDTSKEELELIKEKLEMRKEEIRGKRDELKQTMRELRDELRELEGEDESRSYRIRMNGDFDEEELEERMEKFGRKMEKMGEKIEKKFRDSKFEEKMEAWGEEFGRKMEEKFEGGDFEERMEELGARIERRYGDGDINIDIEDLDDEELEELAAWGTEMGLSVAGAVADAFADGDLAMHIGEAGEGIGEMVGDILMNVVEGLEDVDFDLEFDGDVKGSFNKILFEELKDDGFYKKNKVSLEFNSNGLKINGKSQPNHIQKKYVNLITDHHDFSPSSGTKFKFEYSDKKGKKKNSISIEREESKRL